MLEISNEILQVNEVTNIKKNHFDFIKNPEKLKI